MKKGWVYVALMFLFVTATAFIIIRSANKQRKEEAVARELLPRKTALAYTAEWAVVKNNAEVLLNKIKKNPADIKSLVALTAIYLQEARITGNFKYYNQAALENINSVLKKDVNNFEALICKATIQLSQHQFEEAYKTAGQARQLYPYNASVYGLLVDATIELGKYKEALEAADKMVSIRPDIRSYSRIAYLREIHGDIPGAMEAMQLAIDAGAPGDENTEWCRVQLGKLNEKTGKTMDAKMHYTIAADNRKNYPYALAGLAGIAAQEKDFAKALSLYQQADSLIPDHTFKEGIAEVYALTGKTEKAKEMANEILNYMKQFSSEAIQNKTAEQNEDHEMAHACMGAGDYDKALEYALKEYNRRPANIEVNETVAIVYYGKGDYAKALPYIEKALKTNCKNPELLAHAGLIYSKTGKAKQAEMFLQEAMKNKPVISQSLQEECEEVLKTMNGNK
jgi:tetratricopeptide (TPR) repeat protein